MSVDPLVSIVIVNYNAGDFLGACLASIASQTEDRYEVIVVDNASVDRSLAAVAPYDFVTLVRNVDNVGFAKAQNQGFAQARGRYLMPLNFDLRMTPTFLAEMVAVLAADERVGAVSGKMLQMTLDGTPTPCIENAGLLLPRNRFPVHRGAGERDEGQYDTAVTLFGVKGAAALYRREMLDDVAYNEQYYDESYFMWYEDIDLDWRARLRGWLCVYTPTAVVYHVGDVHGHGQSPFGAQTSMRNRWLMIVSNECARLLLKNAVVLLWHELLLVHYVLRRRWFRLYLQACWSFFSRLPRALRKRRWVQKNARVPCLVGNEVREYHV